MFGAMIHDAGTEPQIIRNRETVVAVVIDPNHYKEYMSLKESRKYATQRTACKELRDICAEESYELSVPMRKKKGKHMVALHVLFLILNTSTNHTPSLSLSKPLPHCEIQQCQPCRHIGLFRSAFFH
jgi:hypothetical protein